jgi:hypothetical protein
MCLWPLEDFELKNFDSEPAAAAVTSQLMDGEESSLGRVDLSQNALQSRKMSCRIPNQLWAKKQKERNHSSLLKELNKILEIQFFQRRPARNTSTKRTHISYIIFQLLCADYLASWPIIRYVERCNTCNPQKKYEIWVGGFGFADFMEYKNLKNWGVHENVILRKQNVRLWIDLTVSR